MTGGGILVPGRDESRASVARRFLSVARLPNLLDRRPDSDGVPTGVAADEVTGVAEVDRFGVTSM